MPRYSGYPAILQQRFNPHPPRRAGDATLLDWIRAALIVSIHTRPEGRAMQRTEERTDSPRAVSIHTRPEGRAMPL